MKRGLVPRLGTTAGAIGTMKPLPREKESYVPSGFFALRTPVLPFDSWTQLGLLRGEFSPAEEPGLDAVLARLDEQLLCLLFVSSPGLVESLERGLVTEGKARDPGLGISTLKYLLRMSTRSTPFGLLAGLSFGSVGQDRETGGVRLAPRSEYECRWSIDSWLVAEFLRDHGWSFWRQSRLSVNTSAYRVGGEVRYLRFVTDPEGGALPRIQMESVALDDDIEVLLAKADGRLRGREIASSLANEVSGRGSEVSVADAEEFVAASVEGGLLTCSDLAWPVICERDPLEGLIEKWREAGVAPGLIEGVQRALGNLDGADRLGRVRLHTLREAATGALSSIAPKDFRRSPLHADLFKPLEEDRLPRVVCDEMRRAVEVLGRLYGNLERSALAEFRERFASRFGEGRLVPLGVAVDDEYGVGFDSGSGGSVASELTRDLPVGRRSPESVTWSLREQLLLRKVDEARRTGAQAIDLGCTELDRIYTEDIQFRPPRLPPTFHVMAEVAAPSVEAIEQGRFLLVFRHLLGPSGARFLGRFTAWTPEARRALSGHLREDEEAFPEAIFAELVHEGEGRLPNVVSRHALRRASLEYLGHATESGETALTARDLLVTVVENEIQLISRSLGRRIIPRLSAAHDFDQSPLPAYRLLCALQSQGQTEWLSWRWGALETLPFLPRVQVGRIVLSRARWLLGPSDRQWVAEATAGIPRLREERELPRWAFLGERDRKLLLDLDAGWARDVLLDEWPRGGFVNLREALPSPEDLWLEGPEGRFFQELIVPFRKRRGHLEGRGPTVGRLLELNRDVKEWERRDWLFLKVYVESFSLERVLAGIGDLLEGGGDSEKRPWFFVRYGDPASHLRLRVALPAEMEAREQLRTALVERLGRQGLCREILEAAYHPEYYRYGGAAAFDSIEELFVADSRIALQLIRGGDLQRARWKWLAWRLHAAFDAWGLNLGERVSECESVRAELGSRLRLTIEEKRAIGKAVRSKAPQMAEVLKTRDPAIGDRPEIVQAHWEALGTTFSTLRSLEQAGRLLRDLRPIARSVMHMGVNRLVDQDFLRTEAVVYELLLREYRRLRFQRGAKRSRDT